jgi:serine protease DegQ
MRILWSCAALAALSLVPAAGARAPTPDKAAPRSFEVPYRLTVPKHVLVRAKINGKGPFNFILDTGAPALFVAAPVCKKLGVEADRTGWGTFDRFEIEGGVVLTKLKGKVETPFQLEGINGLGLAGVEVHGMIGYNVLARYRIEIDFARDKMVWAPLDFEPKVPAGMGGKGGAGGLEVLGSIMKGLGAVLGRKPAPDVRLRGFWGVELADGDESPVVRSVLAAGPAGSAGVRAGDRLTHVQGRTVQNVEDVHRFARKLAPGDPVKLTVVRGTQTKEITVKTGEGL